jgi:Predicted GTPase, probable translation factor
MKIGFIGLPKSGKTTLFNALTGSSAAVSAFSTGRVGPNLASVKVGDERVGKLAAIYRPKRQVYPTIDIVDLAGINEGDGRADAFSGELMKLARTVEALAIVLRNFKSDLLGEPHPLEDLKKIEEELLLGDLIIAEKRLEKIANNTRKGILTPAQKLEEQTLRLIVEALNNGQPARQLELDQNQELAIRCFQFLTRKPAIVILNSEENSFGKNEALLDEISQKYRAVEFAGQFELELSRLDQESARAFMEDMGIKESARDRLTALAYEALGYISFFTVGEDEVRAWNIQCGATALEAAATIHTDLARGFIAAECFHYNDLMEAGSDQAVRSNGHFKLVGKDYVVRDGDILSIRFNV